jgi:hypothetical protein
VAWTTFYIDEFIYLLFIINLFMHLFIYLFISCLKLIFFVVLFIFFGREEVSSEILASINPVATVVYIYLIELISCEREFADYYCTI